MSVVFIATIAVGFLNIPTQSFEVGLMWKRKYLGTYTTAPLPFCPLKKQQLLLKPGKQSTCTFFSRKSSFLRE